MLLPRAAAQIVETEHLTKALLEQSDSLVKRILEKAGADAAEALRATQRFIERQPRVSGAATQVLGRNLEALVDNARKHRDAASDECVLMHYGSAASFRPLRGVLCSSCFLRAWCLTSHRVGAQVCVERAPAAGAVQRCALRQRCAPFVATPALRVCRSQAEARAQA